MRNAWRVRDGYFEGSEEREIRDKWRCQNGIFLVIGSLNKLCHVGGND